MLDFYVASYTYKSPMMLYAIVQFDCEQKRYLAHVYWACAVCYMCVTRFSVTIPICKIDVHEETVID